MQLAQLDHVRVAAGAHHDPQQLVEVVDERGVEDLRVEDDDELFEVLPEHELRVEAVGEEQPEGLLREDEQRLEARLVVRRMVQPAAERAEQECHRVVTKRVDDVRVRAVSTQHADAGLHLNTQHTDAGIHLSHF